MTRSCRIPGCQRLTDVSATTVHASAKEGLGALGATDESTVSRWPTRKDPSMVMPGLSPLLAGGAPVGRSLPSRASSPAWQGLYSPSLGLGCPAKRVHRDSKGTSKPMWESQPRHRRTRDRLGMGPSSAVLCPSN